MGQMFKLENILAAMVPGGTAGFQGLYWPAATDAAKFNKAVFEGCSKYGAEWAAFVGRRFDRQIQLNADLAACRSPSEFVDVWTKFATTAAKDYGDEVTQAAELGAGIYRQAAIATAQRPKE